MDSTQQKRHNAAFAGGVNQDTSWRYCIPRTGVLRLIDQLNARGGLPMMDVQRLYRCWKKPYPEPANGGKP